MRVRRRIGLFQPEPPQADATVRIERRDLIAEIGLMEFRDDGPQQRRLAGLTELPNSSELPFHALPNRQHQAR